MNITGPERERRVLDTRDPDLADTTRIPPTRRRHRPFANLVRVHRWRATMANRRRRVWSQPTPSGRRWGAWAPPVDDHEAADVARIIDTDEIIRRSITVVNDCAAETAAQDARYARWQRSLPIFPRPLRALALVAAGVMVGVAGVVAYALGWTP